ncbi:hypothetical protein BU23DRAFT_286884 [Bimuria novae-zelandiae CBS 107.79]|uniref:Reverse transcriptase domain-containing protein n=1 Tax=Bimuria novae-zelandiae CBS 107.79 TaxID=1447943 RepID=A0A6A5UXX5_9PLEO|nr:hypothetical protein BU23DRAFT_286884 [Bimuria novae-zelandiae CBS 107.79]
MSSDSLPLISPTLWEAAELKIEELERFRTDFKNLIGDKNSNRKDQSRVAILERLNSLLHGIRKWEHHGIVEDKLSMWTGRLEQAGNDKSITREKLLSMEKDLRHKLEQFRNRLEVSSIHIVLLKQALQLREEDAVPSSALSKVALEDEFELVEEDLESVHVAFEEHAFAKKDINAAEVAEYLNGLFEEAVGEFQLKYLRHEITTYGEDLMNGKDELEVELVEWCIEDLLKNGLLGTERKRKLQSYLQSESAIHELTDTLNVKSIRGWGWRNGEAGLPVTARKNAEGQYCIIVEEDIIDMIFLHTLAVRWGMELKDRLNGLTSTQAGMKHLTEDDHSKREFYLHPPRPKFSSSTTFHSPMVHPQAYTPAAHPTYRGRNHPRRKLGPPPPPLPPSPRMKPKNKRGRRNHHVSQPLPYGMSTCLDEERCTVYMQSLFLSRLPKREGCSADKASESETEATLLKVLALEAKIRETFDGEVHGFHANFQSFASSLPHQTILMVFQHIGVSEEWLGIFKRFLMAPLNMGPIVHGTADQVHTRTTGVPIAHAFETLFGEAVLFCLDLAIHHRTPSQTSTPYLLRLRDKCYFVGKKEQCEEATRQVKTFAKVMGLNLSVKDFFSGETVEFVAFGRNGAYHAEKPNRVKQTVDVTKVAAAARNIKKTLAACSSLYEWVRTWNVTMGTYAPSLFGPLAHVFGKPHFKAVTQAYNLLYEIILDGQNLTDHLRALLPAGLPHLDPAFPFEAWIHLPAAYGGLGVKSPYVALNQAQNLLEDPDTPLKNYLDSEEKYYEQLDATFNKLTTKQRTDKLESIFGDDEERLVAVFGPDWKTVTAYFPNLKDLVKDRERAPNFHNNTFGPNPFAPNPYLCSYSYNAPHSYPTPGSSYPSYPQPAYPQPAYPLPQLPAPDPLQAYLHLSAEPITPVITAPEKVLDDVYRLSGKLDMRPWDKQGAEEKWAIGLYGEECFECFGGIEMWWGEGVPREALRVVRGLEGREEEEDNGSECMVGY